MTENEVSHYEIFCTICEKYLHPFHDKTQAEIVAKDHEFFIHKGKRVCRIESIPNQD
jgi:hypothetical protein